MPTIFEKYGVGIPFSSCSNPPLFGMELEIENLINYNNHADIFTSVIFTDDNSLRNNGKELILPPAPLKKTLEMFEKIYKNINIGPDAFSERTSTHVHTNCANMDVLAVVNLIHMYIITEPIWFNFIGKDRENNIYCVPLSKTTLSRYYNSGLNIMGSSWHKYTAFNILPLSKLGTIEFRHLYGTNDVDVVNKWLTSINNLIMWARQTKNFNIIKFLQEDSLSRWVREYLPMMLADNICDEDIDKMCAPTVLDLKLALIS